MSVLVCRRGKVTAAKHLGQLTGQRARRTRGLTVPIRGMSDVVIPRVGLGDLIARAVAFVRTGYPHGVPRTGYIPLLALLRRKLSEDEVAAVAARLAADPASGVDSIDIGVAITRITDELPSPTDLQRVQTRMAPRPADPRH